MVWVSTIKRGEREVKLLSIPKDHNSSWPTDLAAIHGERNDNDLLSNRGEGEVKLFVNYIHGLRISQEFHKDWQNMDLFIESP